MDVVPRKSEPNAEYHARVEEAICNAVARTTSASELAVLFYLCTEHLEHAPEVDQSRLQWIDPVGSAMETVLWRLGELRTEQSAKVLVRIVADPSVTIDGAMSLAMREAIAAHGQACVPYLERLAKRNTKAYVAEIMAEIERPRPRSDP